MNKLGVNWFAEGLTDFEYKKYILLAYLQHVHQTFEENRLYPELADLVQHYRNLQLFLENKHTLFNDFPKQIAGVDFKNLQLVYENTIKDDELMGEIERIVEYSLPRLKMGLEDGRHRYDDIEHQLNFAPVGIVPLYKNEGYLLLKNGRQTETYVYQYHITIFEGPAERYRGLHTTQIASYPHTLVYTYENIKKDLIKNHQQMPNPATYLAESTDYFPLQETLLPVASRYLVRLLSGA
jgi:hypothetical protein